MTDPRPKWIYSAYLQDEWKILPVFTLNYGLRFDKFTAYSSDKQFSPRVNAVWQALPGTTVHAGYSRYSRRRRSNWWEAGTSRCSTIRPSRP